MMPVKEQPVACIELANCLLDTESRWVMSYWIPKGLDLDREKRTLIIKSIPENLQQKTTVLAGRQFVLMSDQLGPLVVQRMLTDASEVVVQLIHSPKDFLPVICTTFQSTQESCKEQPR